MKSNLTQLRKQWRYSEDFKKEIVSIYESGKFTVCQLEKLYGVHRELDL